MLTWSTTTEWRLQRELDVFLRVQSNDERRDVHDLFAHSLKIWEKQKQKMQNIKIKNLFKSHAIILNQQKPSTLILISVKR